MVKTGGRAPVDDAAYEEPTYGDDEYDDPPALGPGKRVEVLHEHWRGMVGTVDKWLESKGKWGVQLETGKKCALFPDELQLAIDDRRWDDRGRGREDRGRRDPYDEPRGGRGGSARDRPNPYSRDDEAPYGREDRYGRPERGSRGNYGPPAGYGREEAPYGRGPHDDQRYMYNMGLVEHLSEQLDIQGNVGLVIGRGGENIKRITAESQARINIEGDSGSCTIEGSEQQIRHAIYLIEDLIEKNGGRRPQRGPPQPQITEELNIPGKEGWIIGKGGSTIRHIEARSGARVRVDDGKCTITGRKNCVDEALMMIEDVLGDDEGGRYRGADFSMGL